MSAAPKASHVTEEGRRVDLHTRSGETICLSFPENGAPLPNVIKLVDPDTGQTMFFQSRDFGYNEIAREVDLSKLESELCHNCPNEAANKFPRLSSGDERLDKQREKLQKRLKERKGSSEKDEIECGSYCHQVIEIPIQGLSHICEDSSLVKIGENVLNDSFPSIEEEKLKARDLKIQNGPEVELIDATIVKVSWTSHVSSNHHLSDCTFELQIATKSSNYNIIYSGTNTEFKKSELRPGRIYKFRVCALKGKIKGEYSPEAHVKMASSVPDSPSVPYLSSKNKSSFMVKWNAPHDNGSPIKAYILQWDWGASDDKFHEIYKGQQRQYKLSHKLSPGTKCVFRVKAINEIGESHFSKELTTYTSAGVPEAPGPIKLESAGSNYLTVTWSKPECNGAEITEYLLEMEDISMVYGFLVAYRGSDNQCKNEKLKRNTRYKFRVSAMNSQGNSKWSDVAMFTTTPERPGRPLPPAVQGKPKSTSFTVIWSHPDNTGGAAIAKYILEIDDGQDGPFKEMYSGLQCEHTATNLSPGHTYKLRLQCYGEGGCSEWSRTLKVRTSAVCPGQANPPVMSKIYKPQPNALHLYWDPPDYNGGATISTYMLLMEVEKAGLKELREIYCGSDNLCTVSGLQPGKSYSFCVRAINEAGVGKASMTAELCTAPGVPDEPKVPDIICRSAAAIQVSWEAPLDNGSPVTGYTLEMLDEETFVEIYSGIDKTYELRKGLNPARYYYFRVKALSQAGASQWSPVGTGQTPAGSPAAVSSVRVIDQSSSHLRLRWRHPANNGTRISSYNIEIAGVRNISYDLEENDCEAEESFVQEYDLVDLQPNTIFRIRVQAVNKVGCGPFSPLTVGSTRELPPNPPALELISASYQSIKLRWGNSSSKETAGLSYKLKMMNNSGNFQTIFNGSTTSYKIGKLCEKTKYKFQIEASNDTGTGPPSEVYTFTTTAQPPLAVKGLKAEHTTPNCFRVLWDPVPCIKRGDTITYLVQSREVWKQDFEQVYQGPKTSFSVCNRANGSEYLFRVCAIRQTEDQDFNNPDSPSLGLKGIFSPALLVTTQIHRGKHSSQEQSREDETNHKDIEETKQLTDYHWAIILFVGFTLFALGLAFVVPFIFDLSG